MRKALLLTVLALGVVGAMPRVAAACYDSCVGAPGTCRVCETGFDLTFRVCVETAPCKCITYAVPSYQCIGLSTRLKPSVPAFAQNATLAEPAASESLAPAPLR